jgi:carbon storage regulator
MLVLTRRPGEPITIGEEEGITLVKVQGNKVHLGIEAPREIDIRRSEVPERGWVVTEKFAVDWVGMLQDNPVSNDPALTPIKEVSHDHGARKSCDYSHRAGRKNSC